MMIILKKLTTTFTTMMLMMATTIATKRMKIIIPDNMLPMKLAHSRYAQAAITLTLFLNRSYVPISTKLVIADC